MTHFMPLERSTLYSPAWFVPFDEHNRRVRSVGVTVQLDRWSDGVWLPLENNAVRTPSGALTFPGLGKRRQPGEPQRHRARFAAPGYVPLYPADGEPFSNDVVGVEFLVHDYNDAHPPTVETKPRVVRFLPSTSFPYPPGTRLVHGVVRRAGTTDQNIGNVLVEAEGLTARENIDWHERTLSDATGAFRLALRWEGEKADEKAVEETFRLRATERPGRTGSLEVRLPRDLGSPLVIEISEQ